MPRPLRFGFGAALVVATLVAGCAAYVGWAADHMPHREEELRVQAAGGYTQRHSVLPIVVQVAIDGYPFRYGPVWVVSLRGPVTADQLRDTAAFTELTDLTLMGRPVARDGLPHLARMTRLRRVILIDTDLTDADLVQLHDLPALCHLYIVNNPGLTIDGIRRLQARQLGAYIAYYAGEHVPGRSPTYSTDPKR